MSSLKKRLTALEHRGAKCRSSEALAALEQHDRAIKEAAARNPEAFHRLLDAEARFARPLEAYKKRVSEAAGRHDLAAWACATDAEVEAAVSDLETAEDELLCEP